MILLTVTVNAVAGATPPAGPEPRPSLQLVLVVSRSWAATAGTAQRYERSRSGRRWQPIGPAFPVALGRGGLGWRTDDGAPPQPAPGPLKHEGDGRAPAGVLRFAGMRGYAKAAPDGVRWPYQTSDAADRCVDDTAAAAYAQIVREPAAGPAPWRSAEHMVLGDDQYKYLLVVTYNMGRTIPGAGSCIFWHVWHGPSAPTAGCTAMAEQDLLTLARWLDPEKSPLAVQLPQEALAALRRAWGLP